METKIIVNVEGKELAVTPGTSLESLLSLAGTNKTLVVAARVDNEVKELTYEISEPCRIAFVDLKSDDGIRIYQRSLKFLLIKAVHDLFPGEDIQIRHSVRKGIFFELLNHKVTSEEALKIKKRMEELAALNLPFQKSIVSINEAREIFLKSGREDRYRAIAYREKEYVTLYVLDDMEDYFYGYMVPSTGYLKLFGLEAEHDGLVLMTPKREHPEKLSDLSIPQKLFTVFNEYSNWIRILGVDDVGKLNTIVEENRLKEFILISEALHEKKIASFADKIKQDPSKKVILIAGPSSSGKTTFAQRLSIQLRVNGLIPVNISVDDYFVDKTRTPLDEEGKPDYEALHTVDLGLLNHNLNRLIRGEEVEVPSYNFQTGMREYTGRKMRLHEDDVLVVEGIHALNPNMTWEVPEESKFKIYISAITSMRIDRHNRIPTTDLRLLRRMVRDNRTRGITAPRTLELWPSVRRGEERNIFPYQEEADVMFNSSLIYELVMLKPLALPLLQAIDRELPQYSEARRLIEFLGYFVTASSELVPQNSILREFLGNSVFH